MYYALFIIGVLCLTAIPVLIALYVLRKSESLDLSQLIQGIIMLVIFAVCAVVLGAMLMNAQ